MQNLGHTLTAIYDSALDLSQWDRALDVSVEAVGSSAVSLAYQVNHAEEVGQWARFGGALRKLDPSVIDYYNRHLFQYEVEAWEFAMGMPCQHLFDDRDTWPLDDTILLQREDYVYMHEHLGVLRRVAARLNDCPAWSDRVAFQFPAEMTRVPDVNLTAICTLLPHLAKSIELGRSFNILKARYQAALAALDCVEIGMCVTREDGIVIVCNQEATRILSSMDGVHLDKQRRLATTDADLKVRLDEAIRRLAGTSSGRDDAVEFSVPIQRRSGRGDYLLEVSPIRDSLQELEREMSGALVMIIDIDNVPFINIDRLTVAYELTPAEGAVAALLTDGWSTREIAEERGVSPETVKSQTSRILQKTGTHKRSELIRLALRLTPPIRSVKTDVPNDSPGT